MRESVRAKRMRGREKQDGARRRRKEKTKRKKKCDEKLTFI